MNAELSNTTTTIITLADGSPAAGFCVSVCTRCGELVFRGQTNQSGYLLFPDWLCGEYLIRVQAPCVYRPCAQERRVCLTPGYGYSLYFCFRLRCTRRRRCGCGSLSVALRDTNCPSLSLDQEEITLWRGLR